MPSNKMPRVIAHRGASGHAPENTLAAIQLAADSGAEWIEIDVNITRDGVPVLHHDDGLERCTDGEGLVIERDLSQLQRLDSGRWFDERFTGEPVATLKQCLDLAKHLSLGINLEIKPCSGWETPTSQQIANLLRSETSLPQILISSFSHTALLEAKRLLPDIPRGSLYLVTPPDWQSLTREAGAVNIHLHANSLLSQDMVETLHNSDLGVYCYTVNTTGKAEDLYKLGVDGVFTNYPAELIEHFC